MSMIDALMMAYTVEMISIEKVVASVKRFSTFRASKELPFDLEDAMVFWMNKVWTCRHNQPVCTYYTQLLLALVHCSTSDSMPVRMSVTTMSYRKPAERVKLIQGVLEH